MAKPPPLPGQARPAAADENLVDRSIRLGLSGDVEAALRWSAAEVQREPSQPVVLFLTGRWLQELKQTAPAVLAYRVAAARAIDAGSLPIAIAACSGLRQVGAEAKAELDELSKTYAKGSSRLLEKAVAPPKIGGAETGQPLAEAFKGAGLVDEVTDVIESARAALEADRSQRSEAPKVSPQALFSSFGERALRAFAAGFDVTLVASSTHLIREGDMGSEAFLLARGELEVQREPRDDQPAVKLARLGNGALIGEMALLSRSPRGASVIAARPSIVLRSKKETLDELASNAPEVGRELAGRFRRRMVENLVRTSSILRAVDPRERPALVERFVTRTFEADEKLISQGQPSDGLHLIASGQVKVEADGLQITNLGAGEVVGEVALVLRRPSNADVVTVHPTVTLHLAREEFQAIIKEHPKLLAELYDLAVQRDDETSSIVAQEATDADDFVLL